MTRSHSLELKFDAADSCALPSAIGRIGLLKYQRKTVASAPSPWRIIASIRQCDCVRRLSDALSSNRHIKDGSRILYTHLGGAPALKRAGAARVPVGAGRCVRALRRPT